MQIDFLRVAEEELEEAVAHYDGISAQLGSEFLKEIELAMARIRAYPRAWPKVSRRARRCRLNHFPYGLVYQDRNNFMLVIAVMHLHRRPGYWRKREQ
jgi:hypothetical protein